MPSSSRRAIRSRGPAIPDKARAPLVSCRLLGGRALGGRVGLLGFEVSHQGGDPTPFVGRDRLAGLMEIGGALYRDGRRLRAVGLHEMSSGAAQLLAFGRSLGHGA